jgi:hypothetical protein
MSEPFKACSGKILAGTGIVLDAVEANPQWTELVKPFYRKSSRLL